jgi:arylsulfatase A-like enzyme
MNGGDDRRPNVILVMCDDLGYGDTGFNGNEIIRTPGLDRMASEGAVFTRFYAGGPVCSPTRGTCLTGRHYIRYGINHANDGRLPAEEYTLAHGLKSLGYATGHFGKWHLGTINLAESEGNRGGPGSEHLYAPPWERGFDTCFSTEAKVPTWDPMVTPEGWGDSGTPFGTFYRDEEGTRIDENLSGDDSRVIMDRAVPFIRGHAAAGTPFLAVIWFHAPHTPVVAGPEYLERYNRYPENCRHYYGCVTAMDEQVGRLLGVLDEEGISENTMVWFCSDNGPEGIGGGHDANPRWSRCCGSTGGLRGRKRSLFDGGVAVPAVLRWKDHVGPGSRIEAPCSTLDYLPTVRAVTAFDLPDDRPIDGIDIMPLIQGDREDRGVPIPFRFLDGKTAMFGSPTMAMIDDRLKYLTNLSSVGDEDLCFDVVDDPGETTDVSTKEERFCGRMRGELEEFIDSARRSHRGADYGDAAGGYRPVNEFQEPGSWKS